VVKFNCDDCLQGKWLKKYNNDLGSKKLRNDLGHTKGQYKQSNIENPQKNLKGTQMT